MPDQEQIVDRAGVGNDKLHRAKIPAAELFGIQQPDVSKMVAPDRDVEIVVKPLFHEGDARGMQTGPACRVGHTA